MQTLKKIFAIAAIATMAGVSALIPSAQATHDYNGDLIKFAGNPSVYLVNYEDGGYYLTDIANEAVFNYYGFDFANVDEYESPALGDFPIAHDVLGFRDFEINLVDGTPFMYAGDTNVYLYANENIYNFPDEDTFNALGFSFSDVLESTSYAFEGRDSFEHRFDTYTSLTKHEIENFIDYTLTQYDIVDATATDFVFVQAGSSIVYAVENQTSLIPLGDGHTAWLLYGDIWSADQISYVTDTSLAAFDIQDSVGPLSGMFYSADFSASPEIYSMIGFYSKIEKNNYTNPDWYNGDLPYTNGDDSIVEIYNEQYQDLVLTNPTTSTVVIDHFEDNASELTLATTSDDTLYDEAIGIDLSDANFYYDAYLQDGDNMYVQFDIYYTGSDAIEVGIGHEAQDSNGEVSLNELKTFDMSIDNGWITIGMPFEYIKDANAMSTGAMLYFGNVDPNEEMYLGYTALYK